MSSTSTQFRQALINDAPLFDIQFAEKTLERLVRYYELLEVWNARLHLVAPASPEDFARRHVLESLLLIKHLPPTAHVADIGSGAGLPILPCLIARDDIQAVLIESSKKKSVFLLESLNRTEVSSRATVIAERFESVATPDVQFVSSRALERFAEVLPEIVDWAPAGAPLLLFGGDSLRQALGALHLEFEEHLIPTSERRFLFITRKSAG